MSAAPKKTAGTAAKKAAPTGPSYLDMIKQVIVSRPEDARAGVSRQTLKKELPLKFPKVKSVSDAAFVTHVNKAIAKGVETGTLLQAKTGGKIKLAAEKKPVAKKPAAKKATSTATKKPAAAKKTPSTTAKKPAAAKKTTTPKTKSSTATKVKKPAAKKAATTGAAKPKAKRQPLAPTQVAAAPKAKKAAAVKK